MTLMFIKPIFFTILGFGSAAFVFQWTLRRLTGTPMPRNWFSSVFSNNPFGSSGSSFWSSVKGQFDSKGFQTRWLFDWQSVALERVRHSSFGFLRDAEIHSDPLIVKDTTSHSGSTLNRMTERRILFKFEILVQQDRVYDVWGSLLRKNDSEEWEWEKLWVQEPNEGDAIWEIMSE
jgi:hypothetical protein